MEHDQLVVSLKSKKAPPDAPTARAPRMRIIRPIAILAVLVLAAGAAGYYGYLYWGSLPLPQVVRVEGEAPSAEVIADTIAAVSRLIVLPEGEEPTIATVTDPEKLKDQPFFARAKPGDKVLLYTQAKKAYLYDPVADKLLEVAPITTELQ